MHIVARSADRNSRTKGLGDMAENGVLAVEKGDLRRQILDSLVLGVDRNGPVPTVLGQVQPSLPACGPR